MKIFVVAVGIIFFVDVARAGQNQSTGKYTEKYDSMDIDEILQNRRLLGAYANCMLDKGKCTAEGKELKSHVTDALQSGCAKCTDAQHKGARKVIRHMINHERDIWSQLVQKYDPTAEYSHKYERELKTVTSY